jgi:hypothetical protein
MKKWCQLMPIRRDIFRDICISRNGLFRDRLV